MKTQILNILIVEDKPLNIAAARIMLAGHNLTSVSGFDGVLTALSDDSRARNRIKAPDKFDVVLTDCMFPKGGYACMGAKGKALVNCQGEMPYGPMVVFHAIRMGVPSIGLITQGNHHDDPFVFAFDDLDGFKGEKFNVVITNSLEILVYRDTFQKPPETMDWEERGKLRENNELVLVKDWGALLTETLKR